MGHPKFCVDSQGGVVGKFRLDSVPDGRGGQIRTDDPLLPKQVRYQAAPRPDCFNLTVLAAAC